MQEREVFYETEIFFFSFPFINHFPVSVTITAGLGYDDDDGNDDDDDKLRGTVPF